MIEVEDITTTIFYYNKDYEKKYITNFKFMSTFRYLGYDFYVLKVGVYYKICMEYSDTDLISVWDCKTDVSEYEAKNIFKKNIDKYGITKKDYETFMYEPKKYKKKKAVKK